MVSSVIISKHSAKAPTTRPQGTRGVEIEGRNNFRWIWVHCVHAPPVKSLTCQSLHAKICIPVFLCLFRVDPSKFTSCCISDHKAMADSTLRLCKLELVEMGIRDLEGHSFMPQCGI